MKFSCNLFLLILVSLIGSTVTNADTSVSTTVASGLLGQYMDSIQPDETLSPIQKANANALKAIKAQDWKLAANHLKAAFTLDPNAPETYLGYAKFHYTRGEYPSAENAILKGLDKAPNHTELLLEHSRILLLKGDLSLSTAQAKLACKNDDSKWMHHYWLADLLKRDGQNLASKEAIEKALILIEDNMQTLELAINRIERQEKIVSSHTMTEVVSTGIAGGFREVEVEKYITEPMEAPKEWKVQLEKLRNKKKELEKKLIE